MISSLLREDLQLIVCLTKIDEAIPIEFNRIEKLFRASVDFPFDFIKISAIENRNIQDLKND